MDPEIGHGDETTSRWPRLDPDVTPTARGHVEAIVAIPAGLVVAGWMLLADDELTEVRWETSDGATGSTAVLCRDDVAAAAPAHPSARRAGFEFRVPAPRRGTWVTVTGIGRSGRTGTLAQPVVANRSSPVPPTQLMQRVAHTSSPDVFHASGLRTAADLLRSVEFATAGPVSGRLLDWGCGCGRATGHLPAWLPAVEVHGCDIDAEAVEWLADTHPEIRTTAVSVSPPTPYPDDWFDVVVSHSVLTHLDRRAQSAWVREIGRISRPGATFVTTTHGEFAARWSGVPAGGFADGGIADEALDSTLDGVAPPGYYRSTFQTAEYTIRLLDPWFETVSIMSGGAGNLQDLVIGRRRRDDHGVDPG